MITIQNELLRVEIASKGAELRSACFNGAEYIWQRDPEIWPDSAPLLFPVVGRQLDFRYFYEGNEYYMPMHGFARDRDFAITYEKKESVSLVQTEDAQTLQWYPFPYRLD